MITTNSKELVFLKGRVNLLSSILQLGHEAFRKENVNDLAFHMLNNSRQIMPYTCACLVEVTGGKPHIISVMGQATVNHTSEYALNVKTLLESFKEIEKDTIVTNEVLAKHDAKESAKNAFHDLSENHTKLILLPLIPPDGADHGRLFVWVVDFPESEIQAANSLVVLSTHYAEALWYKIKGSGWKRTSLLSKFRRQFRPMRIFMAFFIAALLACLLLDVPISSKADFELVPEDYAISYAPINGVISNVLRSNGDKVEKGDVILKYDEKELQFELSLAEKKLKEIAAETATAEVDPTKRAQVKILALQMEQERVKIGEIKWRLSQSEVKSDYSGQLVMEDSEVMLGKEVRGGEHLFEVVYSEEMLAEVYLNEKDASVIGENGEDMGITLYLHARPESPVKIGKKHISISPKPIITETNEYCYRIRVNYSDVDKNDRVGMRGIARVTGKTVNLGYYLFRNMILAWREL